MKRGAKKRAKKKIAPANGPGFFPKMRGAGKNSPFLPVKVGGGAPGKENFGKTVKLVNLSTRNQGGKGFFSAGKGFNLAQKYFAKWPLLFRNF